MYKFYPVNGLQFRAIESGDPAAEAVVLLHGFPEDATCWNEVSRQLVRSGYRTVALDLRGYSPGTRTSDRRDYSVSQVLGDIIAFITENFETPVHVAGHDWGGSLLWSLRRLRPDLLSTATIVSSPHPGALTWAMTHGLQQPFKSWYIGATAVPWLPEIFLRHRLSGFLVGSGLPVDRADYYQERANEDGAASAMLAWYRQLLVDGFTKTSRPQDTLATRSGGNVPTTYLWGTDDQFLGRTAAERTADRDDVGASQFIDGGHWLPETNPNEVAAAILGVILDRPQ